MSIVYLNGLFLEESHASVPISDRGFLFGDGAFTTIKIENGKILYLEEHLKRLKHDCDELLIEFPLIDPNIFYKLVEQNNAQQNLWRMKILITGKGELSAIPRPHGVFLVSIKPYISAGNDPINLCLYPHPITSKLAHIKSLSYVERFQIKNYAKLQGFDDAIVLSPEGYLLETSFSNLFWIENGTIFTPDKSLPLLRGITLNQIIKETHLEVLEGKYSLENINGHASVYICNALTGIRPVKSILNHEYSLVF